MLSDKPICLDSKLFFLMPIFTALCQRPGLNIYTLNYFIFLHLHSFYLYQVSPFLKRTENTFSLWPFQIYPQANFPNSSLIAFLYVKTYIDILEIGLFFLLEGKIIYGYRCPNPDHVREEVK